jgi:hypothetical protein
MFETIPLFSDGGFAEDTQLFGELREVLLMLAVFLLAPEGDPVKDRAPVVLDHAGYDVEISGRIAQHVERMLELERALLVRICSHLLAFDPPHLMTWRSVSRNEHCARAMQEPAVKAVLERDNRRQEARDDCPERIS